MFVATTSTSAPAITTYPRHRMGRRAFALAGIAAGATLAACGPHVRPGTIRSSAAALSSDAGREAASAAIAAPQVVTTPVPTAAPVTIRPPDPAASGRLWFDPTPGPPPEPEAGYQIGFWRRATARPGTYWHFVAPEPNQISLMVIGPNDLPIEPAPPARAGQLQIARVQRPDGRIVGYWVWNAARFAGTQWAPRWEWVGDGRPHALVPN